jgi:uncharacterized protein YecE (DUF72 family)
MDVTADFIYCRLHGSKKLYASGYSSRALDEWARRIDDWAHGVEPRGGDRASRKSPRKRATRDVFVYFDNDMKVKAPRDAKTLIGKLEKRAKRK